ncbi:MAG: exosortase family protein XrtF [Flavobacteriaceae bacterium]
MKNRKIIINFLIRFFVTYFLLSGVYSLYLRANQQKGSVFSCDGITETVAKQAAAFGNFLGYETVTEQHPSELSYKFFIDDYYVIRVVEGCNSISVIILFITFIIAFRGPIKATILFGLLGSLLLYIINIFRVFMIGVLIKEFPDYTYIIHSLIFPGIIYGTAFLLWIVWVNRFSNLKKSKK